MNTRLTSSPPPLSVNPQHAVSGSASSSEAPSPSVTPPSVMNPDTLQTEAATTDQSVVAHHADYAFTEDSVRFPELSEESAPTYAGLGEILGGVAALFSGAPSASFSPIIEQAQKSLVERRTPQKQAPVEVDTAASDKTLQD